MIIDFMRLCLSKKEIPISWGITNIITSKSKISFEVFGCRYQGKISIIEAGSELIVKKNNEEKSFTTSEELFYWLDKAIE